MDNAAHFLTNACIHVLMLLLGTQTENTHDQVFLTPNNRGQCHINAIF